MTVWTKIYAAWFAIWALGLALILLLHWLGVGQ